VCNTAAEAASHQPLPARSENFDALSAGGVLGFAQLLVAQIPSEALLAYISLLALFSVVGHADNGGRWALYGFAIAACAVTVLVTYLAKRNYALATSATIDPRDGATAVAKQSGAVGPRRRPRLPICRSLLRSRRWRSMGSPCPDPWSRQRRHRRFAARLTLERPSR